MSVAGMPWFYVSKTVNCGLNYFSPHDSLPPFRAADDSYIRVDGGVRDAGGVFRFDSGPVRGLQFGSPDQAHAVVLRAFGVQDRQFEFFILMRAGASAKLVQNDINLILGSLKPIPLPGQ